MDTGLAASTNPGNLRLLLADLLEPQSDIPSFEARECLRPSAGMFRSALNPSSKSIAVRPLLHSFPDAINILSSYFSGLTPPRGVIHSSGPDEAHGKRFVRKMPSL